MIYVYTLFDSLRDSRPLISGVYDPTAAKPLEIYTFYLPKTGKSIYEIKQLINAFGTRLNSAKHVVFNDYKQHLIMFGCGNVNTAYDMPMPAINYTELNDCRKIVAKALGIMYRTKPEVWHTIRANASLVYADLQKRGVIYNYTLKCPIWDISVFSGRSKATGFAVQGSQISELSNINGDTIFINFDWVSADMRAIALMCNDKLLNDSFNISDPYQYMVDALNKNSVIKQTRVQGKMELLKSIYSFGRNNMAMQFYPGLASWVKNTRASLQTNGYLSSILGRRFSLEDAKDRDNPEGTVFNAVFQGSVAHAMQTCLKKVWDIFPDNILTENHDSLVMTCKMDNLAKIVKGVSRIMVQPFDGILNNNPQFPVKVSVGKSYRGWNVVKRYNCYAGI